MSRKAMTTALALALGFGLAGTAQAQQAADTQTTMMGLCGPTTAIDWDNSGRIDRPEWRQFGEQAFQAWDVDNDGALSRAEFATCFGSADFFLENRGFVTDSASLGQTDAPVREPGATVNARTDYLFTKWDSNNDGMLSSEEFFDRNAFSSIDIDNDDHLTDDELWRAV